jgi:hypothetical protein
LIKEGDVNFMESCYGDYYRVALPGDESTNILTKDKKHLPENASVDNVDLFDGSASWWTQVSEKIIL